MKKVLMMLFAVVLFASCNKEEREPQPQKEQKHYSLSLDVAASTDENGYKALDHLKYKFQNGEIKPALVPGEEIEVYSQVLAYKGSKIENGFSRKFKWRVSDDGKKLYCKQTLNDVTFNPNNYDKITLVAGIHVMRNIQSSMIPIPEDNKVQVFTPTTSSTEAFSMKVPYFLSEVVLKKDAKGVYVNKQLANNKFKPKGYLLKVHVKNELNEPLSLSGVQTSGLIPDVAYIPDMSGLIVDILTKNRPLKGRYDTSYYTNRKFSFSKDFTVPAGATSSEAFLMWLPEMLDNANYLIDLIVKDVPSQAFYVSKLFTKSSPSEYVEGNMYSVTLTVRPIRNPLEYLSKYAVNKDGTGFLTNWDDFAPEDTKNFTTKNKEVGYFDGYQVTMREGGNDLSKALILAGEEYSYPNGGAGVKWHLPTVAEWNSVFTANWVNSPVQIGDYKGLFGVPNIKSYEQSGNTYEVYTLCFNPLANDKITKELIAGELTRPLPALPTAGSWYWFTDGYVNQLYRAAFLPEISENKRYAFYYKYDYTTHMMTIKCKYVGANPEFTTAEDVKNKINWSSVTTSRTIPAYSAKVRINIHYEGVPHRPDIQEIELHAIDRLHLWAEELTLGRNNNDAAILYNNLACATFGPDRSLRLGGLDYIKGGVFTGSGPKARVHYSSGGWTHQVVYYPVYLFRKFQ